MGKVLSICVPSYNMEKYLNRCIDTFLVPEVLDQLEIIIVNDGSTDGTLAIANEYKEKYPQSIVVIDKPNGHYGSCVNASLKVATGKYFRIVDADDWVDSEALVKFVETLDKLDVDCVCTEYTIHNYKENKIKKTSHGVISNKALDLNSVTLPESCFYMHVLTFSKDLLSRIKYVQSEGICYTDTEYTYIPLAYSKTIFFLNISLYQYYYGRDDQSMSAEVLQKNLYHFIGVLKKFQTEHARCHSSSVNNNEGRIYSVLSGRLIDLAVPIYLQYFKFEKEIDAFLKQSIEKLSFMSGCEYHGLSDFTLFKVPYVSLWYNSKRLSKFAMIIARMLRMVISM